MTYIEIIKALGKDMDLIDLIDRQQAEIERLQKEVNLVSIQFQDLQERAEEYRLKIENLQNVISNQQIEISAKIEKQIKAEAVKEFAERLKDDYENFDSESEVITYECLMKAIDDCVKEMVGEECTLQECEQLMQEITKYDMKDGEC